jgi:hypothetical protein
MTDEPHRKVNGSASFRYLNLTDSEAAELKILIPTAEFGRHHQTGQNVGSILLEDPSLVMTIEQFRRKHSIKVTDCDVFISIYSERNDEIWRAPKTVNYIVNIVNCPIVFSFTSAYPETQAQRD